MKTIVQIIFLLTLFPSLCFAIENIKEDRKNYISNAEYRRFTDWVLDSMARQIMGENIDESYLAFDESGNAVTGVNWDVDFDWKKEIQDAEVRQVMEELYYPAYEQLPGKHEIDIRKLKYTYKAEDGLKVLNVYPDLFIWTDPAVKRENCKGLVTNGENYHFGEVSCPPLYQAQNVRDKLVEHYFTNPYFDNHPVQGLSKAQLDAYYHWSKQYPKVAKIKNKKPFEKTELAVNIDTDFWEITNNEYIGFFFWTIDSTIRKIIMEEIDGSFGIYINQYKEDLDPPIINWDKKMDLNNPDVAQVISRFKDNESGKLTFHWWTYEYIESDYHAMGQNMENWLMDRSTYTYRSNPYILPDTQYFKTKVPLKNHPIHDAKLAHEPVQHITYEMARAYYHWDINQRDKFQIDGLFQIYPMKPRSGSKAANPLEFKVIPNRMEWEALRKGEIKGTFIEKVPLGDVYFHTVH